MFAALRALGKTREDLVRPAKMWKIYVLQYEANDALCTEVLEQLGAWYASRTTARDAGVDTTEAKLSRTIQAEHQSKAKAWMRREINDIMAQLKQPELPKPWGSALCGARALARVATKTAAARRAEAGTLFRSKHDLTPSPEQLTAICYSAWTADQRIAADVLEAVEAGGSVALYLPTGSRGGEIKKLSLQSLAYERLQHEEGGVEFPCLKLTAFETKTKERHLNQFLAHSNPWRCPVGLLGLSLLVRVTTVGPPPFKMGRDEHSWGVLGSNLNTLDARIKSAFAVAGIQRQNGDVVTYLGRHFGTRFLQHQGGSAEGGAARRGHGDGSTAGFHYTEVPLPDLLRLASNSATHPFVPAHLDESLTASANVVVDLLFPQLAHAEEDLARRTDRVDALPLAQQGRVRRDEHLSALKGFLTGLRYACRVALQCICARPRTWKKWQIMQDELTLWERIEADSRRVLTLLFAGKPDALTAMNALAGEVRSLEDAEIRVRLAADEVSSTESAGAFAAVSAKMFADAAESQKRMLEQQERLFQQQNHFLQQIATAVNRSTTPSGPIATAVNRSTTPSPEENSPSPPPPSSARPTHLPMPIVGVRVKHKRESQDDVAHFSTWSSMSGALDYAQRELAPREAADGVKWRVLKRADGREDKSRDKQWRCYRALAIAVSLRVDDGKTRVEAVHNIQLKFESLGLRAHTPLLRALAEEQKNVRDGDARAKAVLGF